MSIQDAQTLMKGLFTDQELALKFDQITNDEDFFALVKDNGFDFTQEEWVKLNDRVVNKARAFAEEQGYKISVEQINDPLEGVAGGGAARCFCGSVFSVVGGIVGAIAGGVGGAVSGAGLAAIPTAGIGIGAGAAVGGIAGGIGGTSGGITSGAVFGDLVGKWIEGG